MRIYFFLFIMLFYCFQMKAQGRKYNMLIGYNYQLDNWTTATKGKAFIDNTSITITGETRKMPFSGSAQANISDESGNLLLYTNGCWIANSTGDTMQNGSGLNPNSFTNSWCSNFSSIPFTNANLIVPFPDDSNKFALFHQTGNNNLNFMSSELYYTVIDMTLDSGLGGVDSMQKNIPIIQDTLNDGIAACKHANGRDWWVIIFKDSTDIIYKVLLTPSGISSISSQNLGVPLHYYYNGQPAFSNTGSLFSYSLLRDSSQILLRDIRLFDFDRCNGNFSNPRVIDISDGSAGYGLCFSPTDNFLYATSLQHIFQVNVATLSVDTVATFDGFANPNPPFYTLFWTIYLASNNKMYVSTANGTLNLHTINYPDSSGIACDVQQHNIFLPCYSARANVNHPNYYLGCDTTSSCPCLNTSLNEIEKHNFNFSISPNPSNGNIKLMYILPQNKSGTFQIFDINGKAVYSQNLPHWSTLQNIDVGFLSNGIYNCSFISNNFRVNKKLVVINR